MPEQRGARGEGILIVDGVEHRVLFTNRAMAESERRTGRTISAAARAAAAGELPLNELVMMLVVGLGAARQAGHGAAVYTPARAWELMDSAGYMEVMRVVISAASDALTWSPDEAEGDDSPN